MDYMSNSTHQIRIDESPAMAMTIKRLISIILLIVSVCMRMPFSTADPHIAVVWEYCHNSEYTTGSAFQSNLNRVLKSLVRNVSTSGFYNSSVDEGQNSLSPVYGFAQCRGDLNSSDCKQCVTNASSTIMPGGVPGRGEGCNKTSASILLDGCFLRYDNQSFYNNYSENAELQNVLCNRIKTNQTNIAYAIQDMLINVAGKARNSPHLFASYSEPAPYNSSEYLYSLAQCWRDLSPTDCGSCLHYALAQITSFCADEALGSQFGSVNCYLRSEVYPFFNTLNPSPSPSPSPSPLPPPPVPEAKRSKVLQITLGIGAATVVLIAVISLFKCKFFSRWKQWEQLSRTTGEEGNINLSASIANPELIFRYDTLREATSNFNAEKKLGEGGFGSVFKGDLPDGREVAVKRLKLGSSQGDSEFLNEVNLISRVQHRNLVKLLGCSVEKSERLLVYEYLQKSSLDNIIFDITKRQLLDWRQRYEIIVGTARGLAYLHEESQIRIIHRDIKASNILLDNNNRPKITDFGLAKLFDEDKTHVTTRVAGTFGYMAPEYAYRGQLTEKADVFSFGVLVLEIISGKRNQSLPQDTEFLIERIWKLYNAERCLQVMDPALEGNYSLEEGIKVIKIGLLCTQAAASLRPAMSWVVSMLTGEKEHVPSPTRPAFIDIPDIVSAPAPHKTSNSAATSSTTPSNIHCSAATDPISILEPR